MLMTQSRLLLEKNIFAHSKPNQTISGYKCSHQVSTRKYDYEIDLARRQREMCTYQSIILTY